MIKIGIAGGIGSGKSYVCQRLQQRGYEVYDCDSAAKRLIRTSPEIHEQLTRLVGPDAYNAEGQLNKAVISRFLLASADNQKAINDIVHPAVFRDFEESGKEWMESAIMYESGIYKLVDRVVVVTAPLEIRIQRVMRRDHLPRKKVLEWIGRQLPQEEVVNRADFELINDGKTDIEQQLNYIIEQCNKPF
jgi:dephospho-CoA kinase